MAASSSPAFANAQYASVDTGAVRHGETGPKQDAEVRSLMTRDGWVIRKLRQSQKRGRDGPPFPHSRRVVFPSAAQSEKRLAIALGFVWPNPRYTQ